MHKRIEHYRNVEHDPHADYAIGCIVLEDPFFLEESHWIPAPEDFSRYTVVGKTYDLGSDGTVAIAAADLNGDKKIDLAVVSQNTIRIVLGNGQGGFGPPQSYETTGDFADGVAIAD